MIYYRDPLVQTSVSLILPASLLSKKGSQHGRSGGRSQTLRIVNLLPRSIFSTAGSFGLSRPSAWGVFRVVADVWERDVWHFQAKSGRSGSCRLFLHFLGKIAVQKMSGSTLEVLFLVGPCLATSDRISCDTILTKRFASKKIPGLWIFSLLDYESKSEQKLEAFLAGALYRDFREVMRILTTFLGKTHKNPS